MYDRYSTSSVVRSTFVRVRAKSNSKTGMRRGEEKSLAVFLNFLSGADHRLVFSLLRTGWVGAMALAEMSHAVRVCRLYRRALINVR